MPTEAVAPRKLPDNETSSASGRLYRISSTDDILSPYSAEKPPDENPIEATKSGLITLIPSCCPERTNNGRYISIPLIYTMFSSKFPPRTEYCELNSLLELTPAKVASIDSILPPDASGTKRKSLGSMVCIVPC